MQLETQQRNLETIFNANFISVKTWCNVTTLLSALQHDCYQVLEFSGLGVQSSFKVLPIAITSYKSF
jgi:hypothetical protein